MDAPRHCIERRRDPFVVPEDPIRFSRPDNLSTVRPPPEAAGAAEPLSFREVGLAASKFLGQELVFRHIDGGANDRFQPPAFDNGSTDAPDVPNVAVGPDNPFREIESAML